MKLSFFLFIALALSFLQSCGGGSASAVSEGDAIKLRHSRNLSMSELGAGVTLVTLTDHWNPAGTMARYALVEKDAVVPSLPEGTVVIDVPLQSSVVYSGIHVSLIDELGALGAVSGVCDASYMNDMNAVTAIRTGKIADCGQSMSPNMERIISLSPDIILLSPYENSDESARFAKTGISVVFAADYMETTPLGRAEWMRFYGRLYGRGAEADSLFERVEKNYLDLQGRAAVSSTRPSVVFDRIYAGAWDVPTSGSVTGHLIEDAGGSNPFASYTQGGSAHLSPEEVIVKAQKADFWLIRHLEPQLTRKSLAADNPAYARFQAYTDGNVYAANTMEASLFEDGAFHPDSTLREMVRILHPEIEGTPLVYYKKLTD